MAKVDLLIAAKLRRIREIRDLKQEDMAKLLSISRSSYGKLERGEVSLSIGRLNEIAESLTTPLWYFVREEEEDIPEQFAELDERIHESIQKWAKSLEERLEKNTRELYSWDKMLLRLGQKISSNHELYEEKMKNLQMQIDEMKAIMRSKDRD
jgi:transcriptional regulator with XRE-family HTH domain